MSQGLDHNSLSNLYQKSYNYLVEKTRNVIYFQEELVLNYIRMIANYFYIPVINLPITGNLLLCLSGFGILSLYTIAFTGISKWSFWWGFLGNLTNLQAIVYFIAAFLTGYVISIINAIIALTMQRDNYLVKKILDIRKERNEYFDKLLYKKNTSNIPVATEVEVVEHEHNE